GATGEVWRGRDETTHEPVALKRLWEPASDGLVLQVRTDAAVASEVAGPHAVRLLEVALLPGGEVVLVMEDAAGGSLASLLARRGRLHPSEVVTILGPLAQALAELHRRGMVHGDLTPTNVLFTADGCPMLADTGLAIALGERSADDISYRDPVLDDPVRDAATPPTAASDCFGLAALGYAALTGVPPRSASQPARIEPIVGRAPWVPANLAAVIEAGLADDAALRPDMASFGTAVLAACGAAPVRLTGPRRTAESESSASGVAASPRRGSRGVAVVGVIVAVLCIAVLVGVGSARFNTPHASALHSASAPDHAPTTDATAWNGTNSYRPIVARLFALRAKAFETGDLSLLRKVYPRVSYVYDMDSAALRVLRSQHLHTRNFRQRIVSLKTDLVADGFVEMSVVATIPDYTVVDSRGRVVARRAGRTQHFDMRIERRGGKWRIHALGRAPRVAPAPASS
ncbi:MAG TPA: protein kinase, partial [Mycobacteriales bacterium]|nr:protein kinase [Mycobacteriales bacterium]